MTRDEALRGLVQRWRERGEGWTTTSKPSEAYFKAFAHAADELERILDGHDPCFACGRNQIDETLPREPKVGEAPPRSSEPSSSPEESPHGHE